MYTVQVIEVIDWLSCERKIILEEKCDGKSGKEIRKKYRKDYPDENKYLIKVWGIK